MFHYFAHLRYLYLDWLDSKTACGPLFYFFSLDSWSEWYVGTQRSYNLNILVRIPKMLWVFQNLLSLKIFLVVCKIHVYSLEFFQKQRRPQRHKWWRDSFSERCTEICAVSSCLFLWIPRITFHTISELHVSVQIMTYPISRPPLPFCRLHT